MKQHTLPHLVDVDFLRMKPSTTLQPYVAWYWQMHSSRKAGRRSEFMHANGNVLLNFNFSHTLYLDSGTFEPGLTIAPPLQQSRLLSMGTPLSCFGILLHPGAVYALLNIPAAQLQHMNAGDYPFALECLGDKLARLNTFKQRVAEAEKTLLFFLKNSNRKMPDTINAGLHILNSNEESCSIKTLAHRMHVSQRQLERQFQEHLGLSAKQYSRLARVGYARNLLKRHSATTLTDIAIHAGFFDQSHFHHDFYRVVGITPSQYRKRALTPNSSVLSGLCRS